MIKFPRTGSILISTFQGAALPCSHNEEEPLTKNRYADAPRNADFTIDQRWDSYTDAEHERWDILYAGALCALQNRACPEFLSALDALDLSTGGIPDMAELSARLETLTGWIIVPVAELVPDAVFFDHLANRRFPAGAFIRPENEMEYLSEPDVFHDIFGHVPLLANASYADFMEAYGKGGARAMASGQLKNLARLYWYTVEFGLMRSGGALKIFGAGILSSVAESRFALESTSPHRLRFDLERVMRTGYIIDDYQKNYFVIDSFEQLLAECYGDFSDLYEKLRRLPDIAPGDVIAQDIVLHQGDLAYFDKSASVA